MLHQGLIMTTPPDMVMGLLGSSTYHNREFIFCKALPLLAPRSYGTISERNSYY